MSIHGVNQYDPLTHHSHSTGHMVRHFFDNTTQASSGAPQWLPAGRSRRLTPSAIPSATPAIPQFPVGSNVICDHDALYDGAVQYDEIDHPTMEPHELHATILPKLRGYDGGPYECKTDYTCKFVAEMRAKFQGKEDL